MDFFIWFQSISELQPPKLSWQTWPHPVETFWVIHDIVSEDTNAIKLMTQVDHWPNTLNKEPNNMAYNAYTQVTSSSTIDSLYTKLTFVIPPMWDRKTQYP